MSGAGAAPAVAGVRQVDAGEHLPVAKMLARSFYDDPVACWSCPNPRLRLKMLERFYLIYLDAAQRQGWIWTAGDYEGAAMWFSPGSHKISMRDTLRMTRAVLHPRLIWRLPLIAYGFARSDSRHPHEPDHFYLAVLGTDPERQGRGYGSALLRQTLDICDADGIPAYLESSKAANVPFYERHGFKVTGVEALPRGPDLFYMWRDPR